MANAAHVNAALLQQLMLLTDHLDTPPHDCSERLRKLRIREARAVIARAIAEIAPESEDGSESPFPPDPEGKNDDRANWALAALEEFMDRTGADSEDAMCDLLCDLMHLADRREKQMPGFDAALERARWHYAAETGGEDTF